MTASAFQTPRQGFKPCLKPHHPVMLLYPSGAVLQSQGQACPSQYTGLSSDPESGAPQPQPLHSSSPHTLTWCEWPLSTGVARQVLVLREAGVRAGFEILLSRHALHQPAHGTPFSPGLKAEWGGSARHPHWLTVPLPRAGCPHLLFHLLPLGFGFAPLGGGRGAREGCPGLGGQCSDSG